MASSAAAAAPPTPLAGSAIEDHTIGSHMWPDSMPNKDVVGHTLPKPASPCYLLLCKGNPAGDPLEPAEQKWFDSFVQSQISRNPVGAPFLSKQVVKQTRVDTWYPHNKCRHLLIYYMPWRQHHHNPASSGGYLQWSWHNSDKNASMVCAGEGGGVESGEPTSQQPVLPIPGDEVTLIKKGLNDYYLRLRKLGLTVDPPAVDVDYLWTGFWNDDAVKKVCGPKLCCGLALGAGGWGRGQGPCANLQFTVEHCAIMCTMAL